MNTVLERRTVTDALLACLAAGTGRPVGDHESPPEAASLDASVDDLRRGFPYCIVYTIGGGELSGPGLSNYTADAELVYQVTSVGLTRSQCEWMADRARLTLLARFDGGAWQVPLVLPTGWAVNGRMPDDGTGGVDVSGAAPHRVFSQAERFYLCVTPT